MSVMNIAQYKSTGLLYFAFGLSPMFGISRCCHLANNCKVVKFHSSHRINNPERNLGSQFGLYHN